MGATWQKKAVKCVETGETWPTLSACYKGIGAPKSSLIKAIAGRRKYKGKTYYYVGQSATEEAQTGWDESQDSATYTYKGTKRIITLDDALAVANVDLSIWQVERWVKNSWDVTSKDANGKPQTTTNHQVKIWFERKTTTIDIDELLHDFRTSTSTIRNIRFKPTQAGAVYIGLADFHAGAYVSGLQQTTDYNYNTLESRLTAIASYINEGAYSSVHIGALGDFIESFTGLNHANSWKGLQKGAHGAKAVMLATEIIGHFLSKINNLASVDMVAGNHDRVTSKSDEDVEGQAAELIYEFLKIKMPDMDITYNPLVVTREIDDIVYVQTHGHHGISKRPIADILFDYGKQDKYNVLVSGHYHSRRKKELYKVVEGTLSDKASYRSVTLPPLFTGNFYSESNGWTSTAGFTMFYRNRFGQLEQRDVML